MKNFNRRFGGFFLLLMVIMTSIFVSGEAFCSEIAYLVTGDVSFGDFCYSVISLPDFATLTYIGSGSALLHYAVIVPFVPANVDGDVANSKKAGKLVSAKIWFITVDQVDSTSSFPTRADNTRNLGNISLSAGEYWHYIKTVLISKPEAGIGANMGDIGATLTNEITAVLGGLSDEILNLLESKIGSGFYLVIDVEGYDDRFIFGTEFSPMILQEPEGGFKKDQTSCTLKFSNEGAYYYSNYTGNTPVQAATPIAASATTVALTSAPTYVMGTEEAGSGLISVTGLTDSDVSRIITVSGSGSGSIKQDDAGDFLLVGSTTWDADAGSQISFKVYKQAAGYKLIEIAGSRS